MQSAAPFHTLHGIEETAESRKDVAIDGAQEISAPLFGERVLEGEERRVANMMKVPCLMSENALLSYRVTCSKSLGLKF